ncbi:hypothetical protein P7C70_g6791, partial [Phenoliferia sp. Uapishka_3]
MRSASVAVAFLLPFTFARPAHDRRSAVSSTAISSKSASSAAHISSSAHSSSSSAVRLSLKASSSSSHASSSSKATSSAKSTSAPASSKSSAKSSSASSSKSSTASKSSASSSKAASSSASAPVATSTKKGLGFNTASYTNNFNLAWAYDWSSRVDATTGKLNAGVEYVPMLLTLSCLARWNTVNTTWNADASAAIKAGSTHLLGFNEPDLNTQSNITPSDAAAAWLQNIEPFHTQVKLISPAITNGGPPMGITWMSEFLGNCTTCHVDAIAAHWYDSATNFGYFTNYFTDMYKTFGKPIWITEFAGYGTVQQQQDFFNYIIPWMENQTFIERYAAFGDFSGTFVNSNGSLTPLGHTYNTVI